MQEVESISVLEESKRGLSFASKEEGKDKVKKDIIIYQGPKDNLVSLRVGDARVLENDEIEMENLEEREDLEEWEDFLWPLIVSMSLDSELKREVSLSAKPKKKNVREPSMASPVETRNSCKLDVGIVARRGRRLERQTREEETRTCLENGCQRTLQECSRNGK